jgi:hypothetical protein
MSNLSLVSICTTHLLNKKFLNEERILNENEIAKKSSQLLISKNQNIETNVLLHFIHFVSTGLYYKNILMIVSDDRK